MNVEWKKGKNRSLNILKFICATLVVFIHCKFPGEFGKIIENYGRIAVPIFFMISGYFVYNNIRSKVFKKFKRIFILLLGACAFWFTFNSIRYLVFDKIALTYYLQSFYQKDVLLKFIIFNQNCFWEHLWFLNALCYCYLIQYLLVKFHKENFKIEKIITILLLLSYLLINAFIIDDELTNIYLIRNFIFVGLPFFFIGKSLRKSNLAEKQNLKKMLLIVMALFITLTAEIYFYKSELYISSILLSFYLFMICIKKTNIKNKYLEFLGDKLAFYIYILHLAIKYIILYIYDYLNISKGIYMWIYPIGSLIVTIIISYLTYIVIKKMKSFIKEKKEKNQHHVLVMGYMNNNLGDDLFFKILAERYKHTIFYMYPPSTLLENYLEKFTSNKNLRFYETEEYYLDLKSKISDKTIPLNMFPAILSRADQTECYINIGGSLFIQNENWKNDDRFLIKERMKNKPSFIIGCNFGPGNKEFTEYYQTHFKEYTDICFRDKTSYNQFKKLQNARLADDIVLVENYHKKIKTPKYNKSIAISVIDLHQKKEYKEKTEEYEDFIRRTILYYIKKGYYINLFSFCEKENDMVAINRIIKGIHKQYQKRIKVINYIDDINWFLKKWRENRFVIGTRFHSMILALACHQEFIVISYSEKTNNYLKDISEEYIPLNINKLSEQKIEDLKFYKTDKSFNSVNQFKELDKYIK